MNDIAILFVESIVLMVCVYLGLKTIFAIGDIFDEERKDEE